jgi:putative chitinase
MKEKILKFYPNLQSAKICIEAVDAELRRKGVYSDMALVAIIATARVEVGKSFLPIKENLNYNAAMLMKMWPRYFPNPDIALEYARKPERIANRAYGGRMGNGPEETQEGWKYAGAGVAQLTGKNNYKLYGDLLGIDLVNHPELAMDTQYCYKILVNFFIQNNMISLCNQKNWEAIRRRYNGGLHGFELFKKVIDQYLA